MKLSLATGATSAWRWLLYTACSAAALTCTPFGAQASATSIPDASASAPNRHALHACKQWIARLPGITLAQCTATQLSASHGQSHQGRTLYLRDILPSAPERSPHTPALRVLVVGAIHGDELTSAALALHWITFAEKQRASVHWRFIPVLNPDGLLAQHPKRVNARGVDLNRNFDTPNWKQQAPLYWEKRTRKDPRRWPGHTPLSEPETQFLHAQLHDFDPDLVVSIHAPYGVLDFDGPHDPPQRLGRLRLDRVGIFPGSLGHYGSVQQGMPVVTIELEHALRMPKSNEIHAMWQDLLHWIDTRLLPPGAGQAHHKN